MPRRLLDRCQPDSIQQFRAAAERRYHDGLALAASGCRTGAIYLWGYTAEMLLKAAYFAILGIPETQVLSMQQHIVPAIQRARTRGIAWPAAGQGHNVRAWAELLVLERAGNPAWQYPHPTFGATVRRVGQRFEGIWNETLRYRKNSAYAHEVRRIREAAEWLLLNWRIL